MDLENGKPSITYVRVDSLDTEAASTVVQLYPVTGRTHQVRTSAFGFVFEGITAHTNIRLACRSLAAPSSHATHWASDPGRSAVRVDGRTVKVTGGCNTMQSAQATPSSCPFTPDRVPRLQLHAHTLRIRHVSGRTTDRSPWSIWLIAGNAAIAAKHKRGVNIGGAVRVCHVDGVGLGLGA